MRCKLCFRPVRLRKSLPLYMQKWVRRDPSEFSFAKDVCMWCFDDYAIRVQQISENTFNEYVSETLRKLSQRSAMGKSIQRCEAMSVNNTGALGNIPIRRCMHFASTVVEGHKVCTIHANRIDDGRFVVEFCEPAPDLWIFAASSASELKNEIIRRADPSWVEELFSPVREPVRTSEAPE